MEMKQQEPQEEEIPIWAVSTLKISRKHCPQQHHPYDLPTWGQIKTLTNRAENLVFQQGMPQSPEYIFLAMLSLLACASPVRALNNHTYWAYLLNPPLLQVIKWTEKTDPVNDSTHMPPPWNVKEPSHPGEEGKLMNISLGYKEVDFPGG